MVTFEEKLTLVPAHTVVEPASMDAVGTTVGLTETVSSLLVAEPPHASERVTTQVALSPLLSELVVNVLELAPVTLLPFILHWYDGDVPASVAVAVKVTLLPEQIFVLLATISTLGLGTQSTRPFKVKSSSENSLLAPPPDNTS